MNYKIIAVLGLVCAAVPTLVLAGGVPEGFEPLVGIPGLDNRDNFDGYINALYALSISVAALIAVIQIVLGGAQYMMDDLISSKSAAKERIRNALIGLLIIIGAVLILSTLNEDLTNFAITAEPAVIDPNIPTPPTGVPTEIQTLCDDVQQTGGCSFRTCNNLAEYTYDIVAAGAAAGAGAGAAAGAGLFSLPGSILGGIAGGATGYAATLAGDAALCEIICDLYDGTIIDSGTAAGQCIHPNNAEQFRSAEIEQRLQQLREEFDCTDSGDRFIPDINGNHRCIQSLSDAERSEIENELPDVLSDELIDNILARISDFSLIDSFISNESTRTQIINELNATEINLAFSVDSDATNLSRQETLQQLEGLCESIASETNNPHSVTDITIANQTYLVCGY